jgi:hypothetical protein
MRDPRSWMVSLMCIGACSVGDGADDADGVTESAATTGVLLRPTRDLTKDHVVGVGDLTNLYKDVDDGLAFSAADDSTTYVRGTAGVVDSAHTVGFSGGPTGPLIEVQVNVRAQRGTAAGTLQVAIYDGTAVVATGATTSPGSRSRRSTTCESRSSSTTPRATAHYATRSSTSGSPPRLRRHRSMPVRPTRAPWAPSTPAR